MMILDKAAQPYQVVLTKADKIKPRPLTDLQGRIEKEAAQHPAAHPNVMVTSSQKGRVSPSCVLSWQLDELLTLFGHLIPGRWYCQVLIEGSEIRRSATWRVHCLSIDTAVQHL